MARRLFTLFSALSLLMCVATAALWVCGSFTDSGAGVTTGGGRVWWVQPRGSSLGVHLIDGWPERRGLRWSSHRRGSGGDWPWLESLPAPRGGSSVVTWSAWGLEGTSGRVRAALNPDGSVRRAREGRPAAERWSAPMALRSVLLPYWLLIVATALPPAAAAVGRAMRRRRGSARRAAGLCPSCGYDLRATPGRCPECGTSAAGKDG